MSFESTVDDLSLLGRNSLLSLDLVVGLDRLLEDLASNVDTILSVTLSVLFRGNTYSKMLRVL